MPDVLPVTSPFDSEQIAYAALFKYRGASKSDPGFESFRVVKWVRASNHSQIIDVISAVRWLIASLISTRVP